jgi:probable F420-dependent oxidoreductase
VLHGTRFTEASVRLTAASLPASAGERLRGRRRRRGDRAGPDPGPPRSARTVAEVKVESLLPLGKLDPGLREPETPLDIREFATLARTAEEVGLDAVLVEETKDDPYQLLALGATMTSRIQLGTSVAMAFPRSPATTAMSAWSLQKLSGGRFMLGLGSQVRAHVERRFGLEWSAPAPWMRDYIGAVRAVWRCWQERVPLEFESEHYRLDLMVPLFDPGPIEHPEIPIHVAAIGPNMCAMTGEVADGVRLHPVVTPKYIDQEVLPALARGAARTGRDVDEVEVCIKPLVGTAPTAERLAEVTETVRARAAFYLSTPSYRRAWEVHDWGDRAREASTYAREGRWDELPGLVDDEMLHTVATIGTFDEIAGKLNERYASRVDRIEFSTQVRTADDAEALRGILADLA